MNTNDIEELKQDILDPLESRIEICINTIKKMESLSLEYYVFHLDVVKLMLKNARDLLREPNERTNISYMALELREVFSELFRSENPKNGIENIKARIPLKSISQKIDDTIVLQIKDLKISQLEEITNNFIICRGKLNKEDISQLESINGGKTYKSWIKEIKYLVGETQFSHLNILSNLKYWGPLYGIKDENLPRIAREIKSSYSTLSKYAHINRRCQEISDIFSRYNQIGDFGKSRNELEDLKTMESVCNDFIEVLSVFENFVYFPSEKYNKIDELVKE